MKPQSVRPRVPSRRMIAGYSVQHVILAFDHGPIRLAIPANIDEVFVTGDDPYWAELWPSAIALAECLNEEDYCRGRRLIELGCGLGLVGLVAAQRGAWVVLTDINPAALAFAQDNIQRHHVSTATLEYLDWLEPPEGRQYDGILASDVIYDPADWEPLLRLWPLLLKPGGEVWLAEPGRPDARRFLELAMAQGWMWETSLRQIEWRAHLYRIHVHRFKRRAHIMEPTVSSRRSNR